MADFDAQRSYTVYEDHQGFYVKKQNPDQTWQKAYVKKAHLEAFFDKGDQAKIPVEVTEDKYKDEEEPPSDGNFVQPSDFTTRAVEPHIKPDENLIKMEFDELNLDLEPGPETSTDGRDDDQDVEGDEDDIARYNNKGVLPKIDVRRPYKTADRHVKIFSEKPTWQSAPKVDFRRNYEPSGGNVEIVNERLKWDAGPRVDSKRPNYKPKGGNVNIVDERVSWNAKPRIEASNTNYKPKASGVEIVNQHLEWKASPRVDAKSDHKPGGGNVEIIHEKLKWDATAKIGSKTNHVPGGGNVEIPSEKLNWKAAPRIDAKQKDYTRRGGDVQIVSEKIQWNAQQKIDAQNKDYQPTGGDVVIIDNPVKVSKVARTQSTNPNYERPAGQAEMMNEVLNWDASPRIDALQRDYKPGGGTEVNIVDEKLQWDSKPKIEATNVNYKPHMRDVDIFNEKPTWNASPRIDAQNQNFTKPERKDFKIHNKKGYDWDTEKPLRKMDSLQNIRWLPVVENVVFDPVKRRWVAAAKVAQTNPEEDNKTPPGQNEPNTILQEGRERESYHSNSPSVGGSDFTDTTTETSSTPSSQRHQPKKKAKNKQTVAEISAKVSQFLYKKKEDVSRYGSLMRDRRKDVEMPEELRQKMKEMKELEIQREEEAYTKEQPKSKKVNKRKHSKSSGVEVLDMNSLLNKIKAS